MADCDDQTTLVEFTSNKDPAIVNAVVMPSVITPVGRCDTEMQRTETGSHWRNNVPMKRDKAYDHVDSYATCKLATTVIGKVEQRSFLQFTHNCEK